MAVRQTGARGGESSRLAGGAGALLLLGTSAVQSLSDDPTAWRYIVALVLEGVVFLLGGIGLRHRVLVLAGTSGLAAGALRALFPLIQTLPLFVIFGVTALVLLAVGAALATLRERLGGARAALSAWDDWT